MKSRADDAPEFIRLLFTTPVGTAKMIEITYDRLDELNDNGVFFDGSSVPGYAEVNSSDLLLKPSSSRVFRPPWDKEVVIIPCSVYVGPNQQHPCDPQGVLEKVVDATKEKGLNLFVGCEVEFFLVSEDEKARISPADRGGYFSAIPEDDGLYFRRKVIRALASMDIRTTAHHHEVAKGQHEIGLRYNDAVSTANDIMLTKMAISEIAYEQGVVATFMPKPFQQENGSGLHIHQSLWERGTSSNVFASEGDKELSNTARYYVGGILRHAPALTAILAPTVNSFKRLRPGYEAPTRIAWGPRNRTGMIRVPATSGAPEGARIECRCPDPSCSPHLAFAAMLAAGMHGIKEEIEPPAPTCDNLFEGHCATDLLPTSLPTALDELQKDRLLNEVLGHELIDTVIELRSDEWNRYQNRTQYANEEGITAWEIEEYLRAA